MVGFKNKWISELSLKNMQGTAALSRLKKNKAALFLYSKEISTRMDGYHGGGMQMMKGCLSDGYVLA